MINDFILSFKRVFHCLSKKNKKRNKKMQNRKSAIDEKDERKLKNVNNKKTKTKYGLR